MLKYLGVTKKKGINQCNILKNAWIALQKHGISACEWANGMLLCDTPSDEIAIFVLSKMYQRHTVVVTSAKLWSTVELDALITEEQLMDMCDLQLLYIEPGVFRELCCKPAIPPPPQHTPILESLLHILPKSNSIADTNSGTPAPLNLCT